MSWEFFQPPPQIVLVIFPLNVTILEHLPGVTEGIRRGNISIYRGIDGKDARKWSDISGLLVKIGGCFILIADIHICKLMTANNPNQAFR